ncbi:MAG: ParB/RepB/Spo0J family partition protein [Candidatus Marinimicrobia bacterium]|nr:ParB/RepB/Spo0J family partition protein [Candidatus Neomarinimicrobiota bacterium]
MAKNKALGRGLDILIPTFNTGDGTQQEMPVKNIDIYSIKPNPYQPRREFTRDEMLELAQSIKEKGLITPITVTEINGEYILIAGERRLRACKQLNMNTIPVYFRDIESKDELLELALIENVQRENLNPIEEAMAYRALIERYGLSQENIAEHIGKKRSTITNSLRLLKLPREIRESLISAEITSGHARAILAAENHNTMIKVWRQIIKKGLSVREAEKLTQKSLADTKRSATTAATGAAPRDPVILKLESAFQQALGTKVRIKHRHPGGNIDISYYSSEDLERILEIIETGSHEIK